MGKLIVYSGTDNEQGDANDEIKGIDEFAVIIQHNLEYCHERFNREGDNNRGQKFTERFALEVIAVIEGLKQHLIFDKGFG